MPTPAVDRLRGTLVLTASIALVLSALGFVEAGLVVLALAAALVFPILGLFPGPRRGADLVTTARAVLYGAVCVAAVLQVHPWILTAGLVVGHLGDLLDGWLARRQGTTDHGGMLDLEADALFMAAAAMIARRSGVSDLVLIAGALRYAFYLPFRFVGEPRQFSRAFRTFARGVCATAAATLIAAGAPLGPPVFRTILAVAVTLALGASFAWELVERLQSRRFRHADSRGSSTGDHRENSGETP